MPFDGTGFAPNRTVEALDRMVELLGPNGERWIRGERWRDGRFCILGALEQVSWGTCAPSDIDDVLAALCPKAEDATMRRAYIVGRNDGSSWPEMKRWLGVARARAAKCPS